MNKYPEWFLEFIKDQSNKILLEYSRMIVPQDNPINMRNRRDEYCADAMARATYDMLCERYEVHKTEFLQKLRSLEQKMREQFKLENNLVAKLDKQSEATKLMREALEFYSDPDNRSARLISEHEHAEKYFKREYIVDVCETNYVKDNGDVASKTLTKVQSILGGEGE